MLTDTAERRKAPSGGGADEVTHRATRRPFEAPDRDIPTNGPATTDEREGTAATAGGPAARGRMTEAAAVGAARSGEGRTAEEQAYERPLWVEEPARRRRLPDPVRTSAVRAVLIIAVTLVQAMVAFLCTMAGSWLAFPMVLSSVASTVVATWGALDVWVTRQVWNQRNGVVSTPSSTARALRRERRKERRQALATERAQERIRRREGAGQVAHS
ncbi:hypothetical protein [Streptomyces sp. ALI-76-A]|jgi:hypothetical protein|uniref:hypothetical protein n=1 Tax=Streptomyces sp. ALI-76-A TaxID=3025736 RepID=UPI00256F5486|nr:hypothetical protein [Streptomyces sp. ALI-76-A]MDL5200310.1 hypothetical protein [Streptomyces sp. ALI-76-A]